jgi:hypothetical protein
MLASLTGALNVVATFFTGSRIGRTSELYSGDPTSGPYALTVGIARDQIVEVLLLVHPVAQGDNDVALDTLRPWRLGKRELALRNSVDPVAVVGERHVAESRELTEHLRAGLTRLHATTPCIGS